MKSIILATVCTLVLQASQVNGLKCFVGSGNASAILPATAEEFEMHEKSNDKHEFKIMTCGTADSELVSFDRLIKNVTEQIQSKLGGLADTAAKALGGSRRKREDEDYACAKIRLGGTAYRSCVNKISDIKLNCTSAVGKLALCYCHEDNCNNAPLASPLFGGIALSLALIVYANH